MGLFDNETSSKKGEVRIGVPEDDDGKEDSKLKSEVESKIDTSSSRSRSSGGSSEVSRKELKRQNERIIELLEKLVDDEDGRETRGSSRSSGDKDSSGMRGGMDELL